MLNFFGGNYLKKHANSFKQIVAKTIVVMIPLGLLFIVAPHLPLIHHRVPPRWNHEIKAPQDAIALVQSDAPMEFAVLVATSGAELVYEGRILGSGETRWRQIDNSRVADESYKPASLDQFEWNGAATNVQLPIWHGPAIDTATIKTEGVMFGCEAEIALTRDRDILMRSDCESFFEFFFLPIIILFGLLFTLVLFFYGKLMFALIDVELADPFQ